MRQRIRRAPLLLAMIGSLLSSPGCIYYNVRTTLDTDMNETRLGSKVGKSRMHIVLYLVGWGDAGTQAAAKDGGIEIIRHADVEIFMVLWPIYYQRTTVVYGD